MKQSDYEKLNKLSILLDNFKEKEGRINSYESLADMHRELYQSRVELEEVKEELLKDLKFTMRVKDFIDWYYESKGKYVSLAVCITDQLSKTGIGSITASELKDSCGYIPVTLCREYDEKYMDESLEIDPNNVSFCDDFKAPF
jgi:hypothetical protein